MFTHLKRLLIALAIFAAISFAFIMWGVGTAEQEMIDQTWNKLKPGDSVYARKEYVTDKDVTVMETYRAIRPINAPDIRKMDLPDWQKERMIAALDPADTVKRSSMIIYKLGFVIDEMFKHKTACVGTYIHSDSVTTYYEDRQHETFVRKWHAIKPNMTLASTNYVFTMPKDFVFADSAIYIEAMELTKFEPTPFAKKKP